MLGVYAVLGWDPIVHPGWPAELRDVLTLAPREKMCRFLPVAWTLTYELMFYAAFAVLFLVPRRAAVPLVLGWAAVVGWAAAAGYAPGSRYAGLATSPLVLEFLAGALVAWWCPPLTGRAAGGLIAAAAAWCGVGLAVTFDPDPHLLCLLIPANMAVRAAVFGPPAALLVLAAAGWERAGGQLGWRRLERVGDASYSIYLIHIPCLVVAEHLAMKVLWPHNRLPHVAWLAMLTAVGVVPGLLMHRWVEAPLMRLAKGRRKVEAVPAADPAPVRRAA
jgi:peptidoglycan/LPS O-acetylase OafA/YrhL